MTNGTVPIGPTTIAGYGATVVGMIAFLLVLVLKVPEEEATIIATAAFTVGSFLVTQIGRYAQAHATAKKPTPVNLLTTTATTAAPSAPAAFTTSSGGSAGETAMGYTRSTLASVDDLANEPKDDGQDGPEGVPEHEQHDLHDGEVA